MGTDLVHVSHDRGQTWDAGTSLFYSHRETRGIRGITVSRADSDRALLAVNRHQDGGLYATTDDR